MRFWNILLIFSRRTMVSYLSWQPFMDHSKVRPRFLLPLSMFIVFWMNLQLANKSPHKNTVETWYFGFQLWGLSLQFYLKWFWKGVRNLMWKNCYVLNSSRFFLKGIQDFEGSAWEGWSWGEVTSGISLKLHGKEHRDMGKTLEHHCEESLHLRLTFWYLMVWVLQPPPQNFKRFFLLAGAIRKEES